MSLTIFRCKLQRLFVSSIFFASTLFYCPFGLARKTSFADEQKGLVFGIGQYWDSFSTPANQFEPVKQMSPPTAEINNPLATRRHPTRFGFFWGNYFATTQVYARYNFNAQKTYSRLDEPTGVGRTTYKSQGLGGQLDLMLFSTGYARLMLSFNAEYLQHKAILRFQPDSGSLNYLSLSSSGYLLGGGLSGELWLIDLWALSLFLGYQHASAASWTVRAPGGHFMERSYAAGKLTLPESTTNSSARMGGLLIEATLRLNFFFL